MKQKGAHKFGTAESCKNESESGYITLIAGFFFLTYAFCYFRISFWASEKVETTFKREMRFKLFGLA